MIVGFIDDHRDEFGVESICRSLQMAPSTYYAAKRRVLEPSARAVRDAVMMQVLMVLWTANWKVYGAHKLWKAARRAGHDVGRARPDLARIGCDNHTSLREYSVEPDLARVALSNCVYGE